MIAAITGHRPRQGLLENAVKNSLRNAFTACAVERIIEGQCHGVDLWSVSVARSLEIPYTAVRPWAGHRAPKGYENDYAFSLSFAKEVVIIDDSIKYPGPWIYHRRNEWMVDNSDIVVAVWDGEPLGGAAATVKYAMENEKKVYRINISGKEMGWLN